MKTRHVKPLNRRNGLTLLCSGVLITSLMLLLIWRLASAPLIPAYALLLTGLMMTFIGWLKLNEPAVSLSLCRDYLHYHHRYGGWAIKWNNIVRVDQPRVHVGWDLHPLPYIGFKIKRYDEFLPLITPRLAVHLLTEQRSVLLHVMQSEQPGCLSGSCGDPLLGGDLLEEGRFRSHEGQHYDGTIAMLAQRMSRLRQLLGYDLLIPIDSLDRQPEAFLTLLRHYQQEAIVLMQSESPPT
ncbi:TPA: DUF2982 domain-containing protein [Aeromonas sobria]|jgi:hypothetical protein|nr:DUF2982 domain-containing protein [Aeromonas sobria]